LLQDQVGLPLFPMVVVPSPLNLKLHAYNILQVTPFCT